ncbi:MAG: hypothetical protein QM736_28545 [Vicinamibacterales bacterium]
MRRDTLLRHVRLACATLSLLVLTASLLFAQTTVRVTSDHVPVWNPGFVTIATTVNEGMVLEVVRRQGNWYEVVLPGADRQTRATGFISVSRVLDANGSRATASAVAQRRGTAPPASNQPPSLRIFGEAGYGRFTASKTFKAVLGSSGGPWFGGGALYHMRSSLFIVGSVEHFSASGARVFVVDGTVYDLSVKDDVSVTPVMGGVGFGRRTGRATVYGGGAAGVYLLRETSDFADATDNVKENHGAYRAFAGAEMPVTRSVATAFEVQYTAVPNGLAGNTADAFGEHDLGGVAVQGEDTLRPTVTRNEPRRAYFTDAACQLPASSRQRIDAW